jgi:uncharacterized radical SAM protein YgiQ
MIFMKDARFLPTTLEEVSQRGWDRLDVILVSGDSYIDSPFMGVAVIGRVLEQAGYRVGIIAQPDVNSPADITRLGEPVLFWGVSGGSVDSMVANHTASNFPRRKDDYTPGGVNNRRPDRASINYTNLIRRNFKNTKPIVLGGIEASLRRIAHYDFWSDSVRRSILFDAKADFLLYGMAERSVLELADTLKSGRSVLEIRGLCYISKTTPTVEYLELPSYDSVSTDKQEFIRMFQVFYKNNDPLTAKTLVQLHGDRLLVHNPPATYPDQKELDAVHALPFERAQHPYYEKQGKVKALETIRFAISTHRGCYGECNFCAIGVHEGRTVRWRSIDSILAEARIIAALPDFKGYILDVGGPTANMYGFECAKKLEQGVCEDKRCIYPEICPALKINHRHQVEMLEQLRAIPGIKKVFVSSGIRPDLVLADKSSGKEYLTKIVTNHVSGQMKIAPEHSETHVLARMGKPGKESVLRFKQQFDEMSRDAGLEQFLTYYLIAAHPGCTEGDMRRLKQFASEELHISPEQVQIFTPTPSTYSSLMYYTGIDPFTMTPMFVERDTTKKDLQKNIVLEKTASREKVGQPRRPYPRDRRR